METLVFPLDIFKSDFEVVYEPNDDTFILIDSIKTDLKSIKDNVNPLICLEVGCGSGAVITSVAKLLGPNERLYLATDINGQSLRTTQKCCSYNGINGSIQLVGTDLTKALGDRLRNQIDLLVFNPPFKPTPIQEVGAGDVWTAWGGDIRTAECAGDNGRHIINRFLPTTPSLLSPNGVFYMAVIELNNIGEISDVMKGFGFQTKIILKRKWSTQPHNIYVLRFTKL